MWRVRLIYRVLIIEITARSVPKGFDELLTAAQLYGPKLHAAAQTSYLLEHHRVIFGRSAGMHQMMPLCDHFQTAVSGRDQGWARVCVLILCSRFEETCCKEQHEGLGGQQCFENMVIVNIQQILICEGGHLGGRRVILLLSGCVNTWSDLHRVCLEAEGARQDGMGRPVVGSG